MQDMNDNELKTVTIAEYMNLMRIKSATDVKNEIENQECELRAKLLTLGIAVDELKIK